MWTFKLMKKVEILKKREVCACAYEGGVSEKVKFTMIKKRERKTNNNLLNVTVLWKNQKRGK